MVVFVVFVVGVGVGVVVVVVVEGGVKVGGDDAAGEDDGRRDECVGGEPFCEEGED